MENRPPPICDYEGSDYQDVFWEQGDREYEDQVEAIALKRLLPTGGNIFLELGAGAGRNTSRYHGFRRIVLLDYSFTQLQRARSKLGASGHYTYVAADIYRLPFIDGLFDTATMIRTIHHFANVPLALSQIRRTLIPGAVFILEYANKHNLKAILRFILRRQKWSPFSPEPIEFINLNFDFHPKSMRTWLVENGFQIERQLTVSHFRLGQLKKTFPVSWLVHLDSLVQLTGNFWQLSPSVFTRSIAIGSSPIAPPGGFFCCPECEYSPLTENPEFLDCPCCEHRWIIRDGIYDFRRDQ